MHKQLRAAVIGALIMGSLGGTTFAVAAGEGRALLGGARNPGNDQSQELTRETEIIANTSTYGTRQSNKSNNGGGAVYGCRSAAGGTERNNEPCLRSTNLTNGRAFEFNANQGTEVGRITGPRNAAPFTTSAQGVATGLNADQVDGMSANEMIAAARAKGGLDADTVDGQNSTALKTRWLLVNSAGQIERQSGGFTVIAAYPDSPAAAEGNFYVDAGEDLTDNGITATIALQNQIPQQGGTTNGTNTSGDAAPPSPGDNVEFAGEISATQCNLPGIVVCAPAGARNNNAFVVSPRNSDGSRTTDDNRKRFYVMITENAG
jgi:hypothetical protein